MGKEVAFDSDFESDSSFEEEECIEWTLEGKLTRTMAHIIDYKMFIAARRIQSFWRSYRERKLRRQRWQAAVTIQRWWRGFRVRRQMWDLAEQRLQEAYLDHLDQMATRIQAFFRGWFHRRNVHDMNRLTRIQTAATEELVHCLMQRLHHLKRTEYIPGYVSMHETMCTSIVEKLTTTMSFRFHNGLVTSMVSSKKARQDEARRHFHECRFQTNIPYTGPDLNLCSHHSHTDDVDVGNALLDQRLYDVATEYQAFQRSEYLRELHLQSGSHKRKEYLQNMSKAKEGLCFSVISSMQKWGVWSEFQVGIHDILKNPERLDRFFRKLRLVIEKYGINCNSVSHTFPVYNCPQDHVNAGRDG